MFEETFWPDVAKELINDWHCYRHQSGAIGLSRSRSAKELCGRLMRGCYELTAHSVSWPQPEETQSFTLKDQYKPDWNSEIIVTQSAKSHKRWHEHWFYTDKSLTQLAPAELSAAGDSLAGCLERLW